MLREAVFRLIRDAIEVYQDDPIAVRLLEGHVRRLEEPLRIAVAGMVKAGKSTLINAVLGEELAPTDAGECTTTVMWFRYGDGPRASVHPIVGEPEDLPIQQVDGRPTFDLTGIRPADVRRIVVEWPAESLRNLILIDTPGIASLSGEISERSNRFFIPENGSSEADAIIYVLRHLHQADLTFLKSLREAAGTQSGAVNALAVLSRADEIGAGRIDSLLAARDIVKRYRNDETLRSLAIGVLPVAGRLAQTARTLQQPEVEVLAELAALDRKTRERMLISAGRFVQAQGAAVGTMEERRALLDRFGLFGIRLATVLIHSGFSEPESLARELARRSGLDDLVSLIATQFRVRDAQLKARAAIVGVENLLHQHPRPGTDSLATTIERILAETHEFRELRLMATAHTSGIALPPELTAEMLRLAGSQGLSPVERLGLEPDAPPAEVHSRALSEVHRWRARSESPLTDRATAELCRIVVRSCEGILVQPGDGSGVPATTSLLLGAEPGAGAREEA
ncbi:dynamin family protein [Homoserinimonas sp. A447]